MRLTTPPKDHQAKAVAFQIPRDSGIVSFSTGTGKSYIQIVAALRHYKDGKIKKGIFVGTKNSVIEIRKDFRTFAKHEPLVIQTRADLERFLTTDPNPFALMQYNCIDSREAQELLPLFEAAKVGLWFDEVHLLKNPKTIANRTYTTVRRAAVCCYGATATPIMTDLNDLYHLVNFVRPSYFGTHTAFCNHYMVRELQDIYTKGGRRKCYKLVGYQNLEELFSLLNDVVIRFYPDMDLRFDTLWGEVEDVETYNSALEGVFYEDGVLVGKTHHSARMMALQRSVNNDPAKRRVLREALMRDRDSGVIVFCSYYDSVDVVREVLDDLGMAHATISGEVADKDERERIKNWFNASPSGKAMVVTLAGGQSLNLQSTNRLIFYDIPFGAGLYIQVMGRVARYFSEHTEFRITFCALRQTIDHYKLEYIEQKQEAIKVVLGNELGARTELPKFNSHLLDRLRQQLMWHRKTKRAKKASGTPEAVGAA